MFIVDYRATERGIRERGVHLIVERPAVQKRVVLKEPTPDEKERLRAELSARKREDGLQLCRNRGMPEWAVEILIEIADKHGVCPGGVADTSAQRLDLLVIKVRQEIVYLIKAKKTGKKELSLTILGKWFGRNHTSISHMIACYQEEHPDVAKLVSYDLARHRQLGDQRRIDAAKRMRARRQAAKQMQQDAKARRDV